MAKANGVPRSYGILMCLEKNAEKCKNALHHKAQCSILLFHQINEYNRACDVTLYDVFFPNMRISRD